MNLIPESKLLEPTWETFYVYILIHPETHKVVYVGSTCKLANRQSNHRWNFKTKHNYQPIFVEVACFDNMEQAKEYEFNLITIHRKLGSPLLNVYDKHKGKLPGYLHKKVKKVIEDDFAEIEYDDILTDEIEDTFTIKY